MIKDSFLLAVKNIRKRKLRSWLTILGIVIGIAAVVALISLGQGLRTAVNAQFGALDTDVLTLQNKGTGFGPPGSTVVEKLTDRDIKVLGQIQGIDKIIPRLIRLVKVDYDNKVVYKYVLNLPGEKDLLEKVYGNLPELLDGKLLETGEKGKVVLGYDFVNDYSGKIRVGDKLLVQDKEFEVKGILKNSGSFTINSVVFMQEKEMKELLNIEDEWDFIVIRIKNPDEIESLAEEIERKIRDNRNEKIGEESFDVQTPLQSLAAVDTILTIINIIVSGIAGISLLIGGLGVMNTMYTSVLERTREIGTMKAIGAKNSRILELFLIESGLVGLIGGLVGALIGSGMALGVSSVANSFFGENIFAVNVSWQIFFGAVAFSFVLGILSGTLPAYQASRLNPVEALRR